jgi:hypothetical protein
VGQTEISGRCYSLMRKNGEWIVVDYACAESHRVSILHNLTDMRRKPSAFSGLCVDRVPVAYHRFNSGGLRRLQSGSYMRW